jgi:DGQHR domain-containing protein
MEGKFRCPVVEMSTVTDARMVVGVISAAALAALKKIPRRDSRNKTGYQREVSEARVNKLVKDLRTGRVDLPTLVLVNLRNFDRGRHLITNADGQLELVLGDEDYLYVVDGQHRVEALSRLLEDDFEKWADVEVPFGCLLGAQESDEMRVFYVVNSTAKSVRTDLALDLLKQQAESDSAVMEGLTESGELWKVHGQQLVEDLAKTSQVWRGRIKFPGDKTGDTIIGSAGLVGSVKSLLSTPYFGNIPREKQVEILNAFWDGIRQILPDAFTDPSRYAIQKSVGVQVLHTILVTVLEYIRSRGDSVLEPASYAKAMEEALTQIEGDSRSGEVVRGLDFWLSGSEGAAGMYSSNAGRRVLTAKLRGLLPQIEVE